MLGVLLAAGVLGVGCNDGEKKRAAEQAHATTDRIIQEADQLKRSESNYAQQEQERAGNLARISAEQSDLRDRVQREINEVNANVADLQQGNMAEGDNTALGEMTRRKDALTCDLDILDVIAPEKWATFREKINQDVAAFRESKRTASSRPSPGPRGTVDSKGKGTPRAVDTAPLPGGSPTSVTNPGGTRSGGTDQSGAPNPP